jgi:hypothetical protein
MSLNLNVNDPNDAAGLINPWNVQAEDALFRWNTVPGSFFAFLFNNADLDECDRLDFGNAAEWNNFTASQTTCGDAISANTLGLTISTSLFGIPIGADVLFNKNSSWTSANPGFTTSTPINFNTVAIHEFGHVLGLGHEDSNLANMNSVYHPNPHRLHADDRLGVRSRYLGTGTETDIGPSNWNKVTASSAVPAELIFSPTSAMAGDTITMQWTQENFGTTFVVFNIGFFLSTNNFISSSDTLLGRNTSAFLFAGTSITASRSVTIPIDTPGGTHFLGVCLDDDNAVTESSEGNNCLAHPRSITITAVDKDLVIEGLGLSSSSVTLGGSTTGSYNIANRGTTTVTESYTEKIYLSTNNTLGGTDVLLGTSHLHTTDLPSNTTHFNSVTLTIPTGTTPGSYFILVEADALATVTESDESNNVTATPLTVSGALLTMIKAGSGSGTVTSSPAGINCGSDCLEFFNQGTIVTLIATPAADSLFTGWSGGGCTGTGVCMLTVNANTSVTATFNKIPRTLTVTKAGVGSGTVTSNPSGITCGSTCSASFDSGTSVTLTAASDPGSTFAGFSGGGCSGTGPCTVIVNADTTVTATFSVAPFIFTDDPLILQVTPMKAVHFAQLRQAINTLRSRDGLSAFAFTDPTLIAGVSPIRAVHITELRTALNGVFDALGQTRPTYTDSTIVAGQTVVKKVHIEEIRSAVKTVESLSVG